MTLDAGADERAIASAAKSELGASTKVLGGRAESDALASWRRGELWLRSTETLALSREEARVLAAEFVADASAKMGLSSEKARKLGDVVEKELAAAFERTHGRSDALDAFHAELEHLPQRVLESARAFLTDAELEKLRAFHEARAQQREERETAPCEPPPDNGG